LLDEATNITYGLAGYALRQLPLSLFRSLRLSAALALGSRCEK
jgi:hypothetical protein